MSGKAACRIRRLGEADLSAVADLEAQAFPDAWSLESLKQTCGQKTSLTLGAWRESNPRQEESKPVLAGYVIFSQVPPEGEILRIAVAPDARRQGVAQQMLHALWQLCETEGIMRVLLEVRAGNAPAVSLYKKAGFTEDGVRKDYYQDPTEDALLMSRQV